MGWEQQVAEDARRYRELHERVSAMSIFENSPDGTVRVTISATGLLTGLALREPPGPMSLDELADEIMGCVTRAQAKIPELLRQTVIATVGTQDPSAHLIVADARARFGEPAGEDDEPDGEPERADWESRPVMEDV
jgi:hypothetical protein